jgi:hypothetical protein
MLAVLVATLTALADAKTIAALAVRVRSTTPTLLG